jgi:hypothetical protein
MANWRDCMANWRYQSSVTAEVHEAADLDQWRHKEANIGGTPNGRRRFGDPPCGRSLHQLGLLIFGFHQNCYGAAD